MESVLLTNVQWLGFLIFWIACHSQLHAMSAGPAEVLPLSKFNKKDGNPPPPFWRNPAVLGGPARRRVWASSGIFALLLVCSLAYSSTHRASADRAALRHQVRPTPVC